jgi:hypothetical protein
MAARRIGTVVVSEVAEMPEAVAQGDGLHEVGAALPVQQSAANEHHAA